MEAKIIATRADPLGTVSLVQLKSAVWNRYNSLFTYILSVAVSKNSPPNRMISLSFCIKYKLVSPLLSLLASYQFAGYKMIPKNCIDSQIMKDNRS